MPTKYVRVPIPYLGHDICSVESDDGTYYHVKLLKFRHVETTTRFFINECVPLTKNETALVDLLMKSIAHHEKYIDKKGSQQRIEERENLLKKIGKPLPEPFIG